MPALGDIARGVQHDQSLDDSPDEICDACDGALPAGETEPSHQVGEKLLGRLRCKLRYPIYVCCVSRSLSGEGMPQHLRY